MNEQPTQGQVEEFWERCGIEPELNLGELMDSGIKVYQFPKVDLNNLFKYAIPKLHKKYPNVIVEVWRYKNNKAKCLIWDITKHLSEVDNTDPALALFWAIWEMIPKVSGSWTEEEFIEERKAEARYNVL